TVIDAPLEIGVERRFHVARDLLRLARGARDDVNLLDLFSVRGDGRVLDVPETRQGSFGLSRPVPTAGFDGQSPALLFQQERLVHRWNGANSLAQAPMGGAQFEPDRCEKPQKPP